MSGSANERARRLRRIIREYANHPWVRQIEHAMSYCKDHPDTKWCRCREDSARLDEALERRAFGDDE